MGRLSQFKFYKFFERARHKIYFYDYDKEGKVIESDSELQDIVLAVFKSLQRINQEKGSTLVLVFLPSDEDYTDYQEEINLWRKWLKAEIPKQGILYLDLYDDFLKLSFVEAVSLFGKDGHYSEEGNRFVAEEIYKKLISYGIIKKK